MPVQTKIQIRRDTGANWDSTNPVLAAGEIGLNTTLGHFKIGDGTTNWTTLSYFNPGGTVPNTQVSGLGTASTKDIPATGNASATQVVYGSDTRLSDSRTPTTHASTHTTGGTDVITVTTGMIENGTIVNEDISATAAIAQSKVSNLTTDLGAKVTNPMTAVGDLIIGSTVTSGVAAPARLGIGTTGQVLTVSAGTATWSAPTGGGGETISSFLLMGA